MKADRFRRWLRGRNSPITIVAEPEPDAWRMSKHDAPCCRAKVDSLGRFQPGYCGPDCIRRPR